MSTTVRDPWSDALLVATEDVLDDDVAAVRRTAWVRQALRLLLGAGVLVVIILLADAVAGSSLDDLWRPSVRLLQLGFGLEAVGFVLMAISSITSTRAGAGRFLRPESMLGPGDRAWLRRRIAAREPVPPARQEVAVAVARRTAADAAALPKQLGYLVLCVGLNLNAPLGSIVVLTVVLATWTVVDATRSQVRATRARRWLVRHD